MKVSLVILAGGSGKRFGGFKPIFRLLGRELISWVLDRLAPAAEEAIVVVRNSWQADLLPARLRVDKLVFDEGEGLLAGLSAGLKASSYSLVAVAPSDTPFLDVQIYYRLTWAIKTGSADVAVPVWGAGLIEPLVMVCRRDRLLKLLRIKGFRRVRDLVLSARHVYVRVEPEEASIPPENMFLNVNTRRDLALAEKIAAELLAARLRA